MITELVPNLSERITSSDCIGCQKNCCERWEIFYKFPDKGDLPEQLWYSEIERFKMLEGLGDKISTRDTAEGTWLIFNIPCRHLNPDKTCSIYNSPDRPLLCRHFPYSISTEEDCPRLTSHLNLTTSGGRF